MGGGGGDDDGGGHRLALVGGGEMVVGSCSRRDAGGRRTQGRDPRNLSVLMELRSKGTDASGGYGLGHERMRKGRDPGRALVMSFPGAELALSGSGGS